MKRNIFFISLSIAFIANGCILEDIPEPCEDGFHEEDGQCIENPNKTEACGYPEVNCLTLEGVLTASCDSGHCVASACKDGYYPENKSTCVSGEGDKCDLN